MQVENTSTSPQTHSHLISPLKTQKKQTISEMYNFPNSILEPQSCKLRPIQTSPNIPQYWNKENHNQNDRPSSVVITKNVIGSTKTEPAIINPQQFIVLHPQTIFHLLTNSSVLIPHKNEDNQTVSKEESKEKENDRKIPELHNCPKCEYATYCKYKLRAHIKKNHRQKMYVCDMCVSNRLPFLSLQTAEEHIREKHRVRRCGKCDYRTRRVKYLARHRECWHAEGVRAVLKCHLCEYETKTDVELDTHMWRMHNFSNMTQGVPLLD